jgi:hypothetical protein
VIAAGLVALALPAAGSARTNTDQANARRAVLRLSDFPSGWTAKPSHATCRLVDRDGATGFASSARFDRGQQATVKSVAAVFPTSALARTRLGDSVRLNHSGCIRSAALKSLGKDITITRLSGSPLSFGRYGDRTSAKRIDLTIRAKSDGSTITLHYDLVFVLQGRTVAGFAFQARGFHFGRSLERSLARAVAARMTR